MAKRFELTLEECKDIYGKSILDIGCGSGRYSVDLAKRKAACVLGIDFSENMLRLAQKYAADNHVSNICEFIAADFITREFKKNFDVSIAMGSLNISKNQSRF